MWSVEAVGDSPGASLLGASSVTVWTPLQIERSFILGDANWTFFQVGYRVDTPTYRKELYPWRFKLELFFPQVGYPVTPTDLAIGPERNGDICRLAQRGMETSVDWSREEWRHLSTHHAGSSSVSLPQSSPGPGGDEERELGTCQQ